MPDSKWQRLLLQSKRALNKSTIDIIQNPVGIAGGVVNNAINSVLTGDIIEDTALEGITLSAGTLKYSRLWRYRMLTQRESNMEKSEYNPRPQVVLEGLGLSLPHHTGYNDKDNIHTTRPKDLSPNERKAADRIKIEKRRSSEKYEPKAIDFTVLNKNSLVVDRNTLKNSQKGRLNNIFIINENVSPYISIQLQSIPTNVEINPHGTWAVVQSMGRNNPFRMYTGGEDTVSFEVSWYSSDPSHREEVIAKCRLLESWCKADGYVASPPVLKILWGNTGLFENCLFILESAPYKLTNFQDRARAKGSSDILDLKLYPNCATQQLTFKKVSMINTTYEDILPYDQMAAINGIKV